jgi:hypothetical protein
MPCRTFVKVQPPVPDFMTKPLGREEAYKIT